MGFGCNAGWRGAGIQLEQHTELILIGAGADASQSSGTVNFTSFTALIAIESEYFLWFGVQYYRLVVGPAFLVIVNKAAPRPGPSDSRLGGFAKATSVAMRSPCNARAYTSGRQSKAI